MRNDPRQPLTPRGGAPARPERPGAAARDRGGALGEAPGLYVHVPFCRTKCPYCDFASITAESGIARWLGAVRLEAERRIGTFGAFDTLYIGGGTPSVLGEAEIEELFETLVASFELSRRAEVTIEANPDDVSASRLAVWRGLGVNRLSIGAQSFDDAELRVLRRRHDAARSRAAVELARAAGFENIGIDLIYGIPGQSLESWERSMRRAVELSPEHLSCYQLTIEPATEFGRLREAGALAEIEESVQRAFFLRTSRYLVSRGYLHYEISNFARGDSLVSRHNGKYWRHVPYLGLGPAAHSFAGGRRWWNARSVETYVRLLEEGGSPVDGEETLGDDELTLEAIYLGFRTREGAPLEALERRPGSRRILEELVASSLVVVERGRAVPTLEGFCVADRLAAAFT
jgi:putative oxygen-independent coproporphyrinogen III oxidase